MIIEGESFASEYKDLLLNVVEHPHFCVSPRTLNCNELLSYQLCVDPYNIFFQNEARSFDKLVRYFVGETLWYFGGRKDLAFIENYSKFWRKIARLNGECNSAYGNLLFTMIDTPDGRRQWEWAYDSLCNDKDTRQAVVHFNRPCHQYPENKDFVCTMYCNFLIRKNKLFLISRMRSQDIVLGLTYDVPFFGLLQQNMLLLLRDSYPELEIGSLLHSSDSMHLYGRDKELADKMISDPFREVKMKLARPLVNKNGLPTDFYWELFNDVDKLNHPPEGHEVYKRVFQKLGGDSF